MSKSEEYTPDTGAVRAAYTRAMRQAFIASTSEHIEEFDRWLAAHDRALREQFAREMLSDDALGRGYVRLMATRRGEHPVATFSAAVQKVVSNAAQIARVESE